MKKILLIIIAIVLVTNTSFGQDNLQSKFQFGIKAGANYSNIYDSQGDEFTADAKFGMAGGVFVAIPLGNVFGIQPEILYSQKGYKQTGSFLGSTYGLTRTTDYIDVPLLLSIKPISLLTIQVGPQYSFLTKQKDIFTNSLSTIEQQKEFTNNNIRKNTLCFVGGIDFNFKRIVIGTRTGWDVQNNNGNGTSTNPRYKNAFTQATLGFHLL